MLRKTVMVSQHPEAVRRTRQRKFRAVPSKTYGKRRRGYARARHQLQIGTHRSLQQVSLLKRMTDRFLARFETGVEKSLAVLVARLIGTSFGLSAEYVHGRMQVMRSANVLIGVISVCISYIYKASYL